MKTPLITSVIGIILLFILNSCENDDNMVNNNTKTIVGTGSVVSDTISLSAFNSVKNLATFRIQITKGTPQQVILKAQRNILDVVTYQVNNEELLLGVQNNVNIQTPYGLNAEITAPEITRVGIIGAGDFDLTGAAQSILYIDIIGTGNIRAYNLTVDTCYITTTGVGDCYVRVNNLLNILISGVGHVYYKGNPSIISNITGVGSIVDDN
jgi:Putative auto-transporter adhesin, head GIN domain